MSCHLLRHPNSCTSQKTCPPSRHPFRLCLGRWNQPWKSTSFTDGFTSPQCPKTRWKSMEHQCPCFLMFSCILTRENSKIPCISIPFWKIRSRKDAFSLIHQVTLSIVWTMSIAAAHGSRPCRRRRGLGFSWSRRCQRFKGFEDLAGHVWNIAINHCTNGLLPSGHLMKSSCYMGKIYCHVTRVQ